MSGAAAKADKGGGGAGGRPAAERIQPKLQVGDVNDPMEHEADQVAEQVVSGQPAAAVQRMAAPEKKESVNRAAKKEEPVRRAEKKDEGKVSRAEKKDEGKVNRAEKKDEGKVSRKEKKDEGAVSRKADGAAPSGDAMSSAAQHAVDTKGAGRPMDAAVRGPIESSLGADMSHVRVHDDSAAQQSASAINARAFTHGSDIWVGAGESPSNLQLMAHEATHVVQQGAGVHRLVQRDPTPPAPGAAPAMTPEQAMQDLQTFRLPPVKQRHRPLYETWAAAGTLKRVKGYERGEPDQRDAVWKPSVTPAQERLDAIQLPPTFTGVKSISVHGRPMTGTREQLVDRLRVPQWDRTGHFDAFPFEVDHMVELQVGSWGGGSEGAANQIANMELLDKSSNASAGSRTRYSIRDNVRRYLENTGQSIAGSAVSDYLADNDVVFNRVEIGTEGSASGTQYWTKAEIEAGAHLTAVQPIANVGEQGTAASFALVSPDNMVLGQYPHAESVLTIPVEGEIDQTRIAGLRITGITLQATYASAARDAAIGSIQARLLLPPSLSPIDAPFTIPLQSAGQYSGYVGPLPAIGETHFGPMSLLTFDPPTIEPEGLTARARLTPSIPLLGTTPIDVVLRGNELAFVYFYSAGELALPIPGVSIDDVTLGVIMGTEGFRVEGGLYFSVQRLGHGSLNASVNTSGNFEASGSFDFDSELFDQARIEIWYRDRAFGGRGTLAITQPNKVRGIRSLNADVTFSESSVTAIGTVEPDIPGVDTATLNIQYSEADGLVIGGSATLSNLPGISSGTLEAEVRRPPGGGPWAVSAHGTAVPAIPGVDTSLAVVYDNGALTVSGSADYSRGMLSGHVELGATNRVVGDDGVPTDEIGTELVAYGGGSLTVQVTPWLQGTVGVRFLPNGELELTGRIELPSTLDIFPEKRFDRNIFSINVDIPILGFAVAGQRVGIFATIGGGLDLSAGVGPGQLRDLGIGITYNPDHEDQTHITGSARLVIPADAGLRLFIRGALGAGIPIVSASLGLEVGGQLGLEGAVEAGVNVDWTPATGLVIDALGEIYVQPKFRFDLTGFLSVDADLILDTINLYEQRWELASFEAGPDLRFGVRFPIHYEEGQPFDISLDDIEFDVPEIDTMGLIGDLIERIV